MDFLKLYEKRSEIVDWDQGKEWFSPHTEWDDSGLKVAKLPNRYSFNLVELREELAPILLSGSFVHRPETYRNDTYSGVSLTTRGLTDDPNNDWWTRVDATGSIIHDHSKQLFDGKLCLTHESEYKENTLAMTDSIKKIMSSFRSKISRVALMKLNAGGAITPHVDFPYYHCIRLHACLVGSSGTTVEVQREKFTIPEDGSFYLLDTGKTHGVKNTGDVDRINLNINIIPDQNLLKEYGLKGMIDRELL